MTAWRNLVAALGAAGMLAGCTLWPFGDDEPQGAAKLEAFQPSAELQVLWRGAVSANDHEVLRPAVAGNSIYAGGGNGVLARFDSGREQWRLKEGEPWSAGVASDARMTVVGSRLGQLRAYDSVEGKPLWTAPLAGEPTGQPLLTDELVLVRVADNQVVALDRSNGAQRWIYQRASSPLSLRGFTGMLRAENLVVVGFAGGKLVALALSSGSSRWEVAVTLPKGSNEIERLSDVVGDPLATPGGLCAAAFQGRVACFDPTRGSAVWTRDISSGVGIAADERALYVTEENGSVYALDLRTGATVWKQDRLLNRHVGRPLVVGEYIVVLDGLGWAHLLSRRDGAFAARLSLDSSGFAAPPTRFDPGFVAQARDGSLYYVTVR